MTESPANSRRATEENGNVFVGRVNVAKSGAAELGKEEGYLGQAGLDLLVIAQGIEGGDAVTKAAPSIVA